MNAPLGWGPNRTALLLDVSSLFGGGALARSSARGRGGGNVGASELRLRGREGAWSKGYKRLFRRCSYKYDPPRREIKPDLDVQSSEIMDRLHGVHS